jgi:ABC transporter
MDKRKKIYLMECLKIVYKIDFIPSCMILVLKLVSALVPTLQTLVVAEFINYVTTGKVNLLEDSYIRIIILLMVILVAYIWISKSLIELLGAHVEMKVNAEFKPKLVEKISRLEYRFMEDGDTRDKISRVNSDVSVRVKDAYMEILRLVELILKVVGILIIMFTQVWWASLFILVISVPCFYVSMKSGKAEYDAEAEVSKINRVNAYYNEMLKNREYRDERSLFQYQNTFITRFSKQYEDARKFKTRIKLKWYIRMKMGSMATIVVSAVMIAVLVPLTLNGRLSIGMFMALTNSVFNIVQNMSWDLTWAIDRNTWFNEYFKDMESIWNMEEEDVNFVDKKKVHVFESLEFKNVFFRYPGTEKYILNNLSFKIVKDKNYAFVGANGVGKSTIIKLINGLYKEYDGQILVNGQDIREYHRGFIATIFQDFARYPISVKDNIVISRQDIVGDKEVEKIVEEVGLKSTISKLNNGINTVLGKFKKNSVDVSGGEWQKIALARCGISNAPVQILDEPTSAMDPIYETMIYKKFKEISKGRTMILISHRLASVQMSDIIFVLENGTLVEEGTHFNLVRQGGVYEKMYKEQAKWYREEGEWDKYEL